jgi:type IV pilus biogenesis protein PilP
MWRTADIALDLKRPELWPRVPGLPPSFRHPRALLAGEASMRDVPGPFILEALRTTPDFISWESVKVDIGERGDVRSCSSSRPPECSMPPSARKSIAFALIVAATLTGAQSIGDYSRAQRALLEAGMVQAAARSMAMAASGAAPSASGASAAGYRAGLATLGRDEPVDSNVEVRGVFESRMRTFAEVSVGGTAYLLSSGQPVPGTGWFVKAVSADRVVLSRPGPGGGSTRDGRSASLQKTYALPALR